MRATGFGRFSTGTRRAGKASPQTPRFRRSFRRPGLRRVRPSRRSSSARTKPRRASRIRCHSPQRQERSARRADEHGSVTVGGADRGALGSIMLPSFSVEVEEPMFDYPTFLDVLASRGVERTCRPAAGEPTSTRRRGCQAIVERRHSSIACVRRRRPKSHDQQFCCRAPPCVRARWRGHAARARLRLPSELGSLRLLRSQGQLRSAEWARRLRTEVGTEPSGGSCRSVDVASSSQ